MAGKSNLNWHYSPALPQWPKFKFNNYVADPETETVVANLVYDESQDQLHDSSLLDSGEPVKIEHPNPVFQAFDDAKNVDDLYRIAEIWVNPTVYYNQTED